jgi:hypothetical protein
MKRVNAARRADWRYVLPRHGLRRIAVIVPPDAEPDQELLTALADGATDVRITRTSELRAAETHDRDLLVLPHADASTIRWAAAAAGEECLLYAELRRRPSIPLRGTRAIEADLRRHGFEPLAVHWHRPDHEHCQEIVPLGSRRAVIAALRRGSRGRRAALASALGILLVRMHVFDRVAWPVSVTARWTQPS